MLERTLRLWALSRTRSFSPVIARTQAYSNASSSGLSRFFHACAGSVIRRTCPWYGPTSREAASSSEPSATTWQLPLRWIRRTSVFRVAPRSTARVASSRSFLDCTGTPSGDMTAITALVRLLSTSSTASSRSRAADRATASAREIAPDTARATSQPSASLPSR